MTIRLGATGSVLVAGLALLVACGGKDDHAGGFIDPTGDAGAPTTARAGAGGAGGRAQTGGAGGTVNRGGSGGAAGSGTSSGGPKVEITYPKAATDPNVDTVLIDNDVTVACTVTKSTVSGAAVVDPSSVQISMLDADGKELKVVAGVPTQKDNEYSGTFALGPVPSGAVSFQCSASDQAKDPQTSTDTVDTLIDHGPEITIVEPADKSAHNLLGSMAVEFDTAPMLIAKGDKQADVSDVSLTVYGSTITTVNAGSGKHTATVNFNDKDLFLAPPTGTVPVVITASNKRKAPGKATQSLSYSIVVDGTAPSVTVVSPASQAVVGRASVLKFSVSDSAAGVDNSTVTVKLNDSPYSYSATNGKWNLDSSGLFTFQFGAELLAQKGDTQVLVNIEAKDKAGNSGKGSANYNLDNQPPIVDMDPPNLYEETVTGDDKICSDYFDPLGSEAPNDLAPIVNYGRFRALAYDDTNKKAGQTDFFYALVDRSSVQIFVQYDTSSPLLADDDGDGTCDEIWTGTAPHQKNPTDKPIPFDGLLIVTPGSDRGSVTYPTSPDKISVDAACSGGTESKAPTMCLNGVSDMSVIIHHGVGLSEPVIYAIDPINSNQQPLCTGQTWDVSAAIKKLNASTSYVGWICVAARAVDNVGNPGVSAPLRLCLDDGFHPHACDGVPPPKCTDNCTAPPHFSGVVSHK